MQQQKAVAVLLFLTTSVAHCGYDLFFINETATTYIYTLSLHDALPILDQRHRNAHGLGHHPVLGRRSDPDAVLAVFQEQPRSEEHTSELQSRRELVCRLLLEKKNAERQNHRDDNAERSYRCSRVEPAST